MATNLLSRLLLLAVLSLFNIPDTKCDKIFTAISTSQSPPKLVSKFENQLDIQRPLLDGKIIGGYPIDIKDAPYQVSLRVVSHKCGGILIAKNWILTAGHCTFHLQPYHYYIYMGSSNTKKNGLLVKAAELYRHPNYTNNLDYDFTLIKLHNYNASGFNIGIAKLPEQNEEIPNNIKLRVSGWGKTEINSLSREILRAVDVITINRTICQKLYEDRGGITDRMFCAGYIQGGKDSCQGDSGGPIVIGNKAIGVVSWGYGCGLPNYPGVYGKISAVRDWIKSTCGV